MRPVVLSVAWLTAFAGVSGSAGGDQALQAAGVSSQEWAQPVIEVIHSDADRIHGYEMLTRQGLAVHRYNLDDGKRLLADLAQGLPPDQAGAKNTLAQHFQTLGLREVQKKFRHAYQGHMVATQYGLTRYPAVVFNQGLAVVYGETDLVRALARYRQWRHATGTQ